MSSKHNHTFSSTINSLHATNQEINTLFSKDYWRSLCPDLHVHDKTYQTKILNFKEKGNSLCSIQTCNNIHDRIVEDGYAVLSNDKLRWSQNVKLIADGITRLLVAGWPASAIMIYDEAWAMALDCKNMMKNATGNSLCMDIVGFVVDPKKTHGFSPHRDRQPEDWMPKGVEKSEKKTFKKDGMAKYVTVWVALTDAHPDNSCLHFIPAGFDPGYYDGDSEEGDPLALCFTTKESYQHIRAAPVNAGGCTFHTHRTIHWGSSGRPSYNGSPRISLSFGFSDHLFEPSYFSVECLPFPKVDLRVSLMAGQIVNYATLSLGDAAGWIALAGPMANSDYKMIKLLFDVYLRNAKKFHLTYQKEIATKAVDVLRHIKGSEIMDIQKNIKEKEKEKDEINVVSNNFHDNDSEEEEAMLERILKAERISGGCLFHDDWDILQSDSSDCTVGEPTVSLQMKQKCKTKSMKKSSKKKIQKNILNSSLTKRKLNNLKKKNRKKNRKKNKKRKKN